MNTQQIQQEKLTQTIEQQKEDRANKEREKIHNKILNDVREMKKGLYCVNQLLTNNKELLENLNKHYPHINKVRNGRLRYKEDGNLKIEYIFDKYNKTRRDLNIEILKFVIKLIYHNKEKISKEELNNIFILSYYCICRDFKTQFKIITKNSSEENLTSINKLYEYIRTEGKNKIDEKIFNQDIIKKQEQEIIKNDCNICFEEYNFDSFEFVKCDNCLNLKCCNNCFKSIQHPKKCPTCRSANIKLIEIEEGDREIKFIHNNQIIKETYNINSFSRYNKQELLLIYYEFNEYHNKYVIENKLFEIKTKGDTEEEITDYYRESDDMPSYCEYVLEEHRAEEYIGTIDRELFKILINAYFNTGDYGERVNIKNKVRQYIGFDDDNNIREFIKYLIRHDGAESVIFNNNFYDYISYNSYEKEYYLLTSDDSIKDKLFNESYDNSLELLYNDSHNNDFETFKQKRNLGFSEPEFFEDNEKWEELEEEEE